MFTARSLPEVSMGYYVPALPYVRAVISVDFGTAKCPDQPDSINGCEVNAATMPEGAPKKTRNNFSYITRNGPEGSDTWNTDEEGCDMAIQQGEAYKLWQQIGYGICCTGSLKEAQFLTQQCGIKDVVFIDEAYLENLINHVSYFKDVWAISKDISGPNDLVQLCTNSFFKNQRLCQLIENYQRLYYENATNDELKTNKIEFQKLKHVSSLLW